MRGVRWLTCLVARRVRMGTVVVGGGRGLALRMMCTVSWRSGRIIETPSSGSRVPAAQVRPKWRQVRQGGMNGKGGCRISVLMYT